MLGSDVLDVGIGMTLLFLFASLVCSAMREAIETVMKSRAMDLERGIRELLKDPDGENYVKKFFDHPSIFGLYTGTYDPSKLKDAKFILGTPSDTKVMPRAGRSNLPTYIPSQNFSAALFDLVRRAAETTAGPDAPLSAASLREGIKTIDNEPIRYALLSALDEADDDLTKARKSIEAWYDASMDRVSGWYKRRTQGALLLIGLATAALFNIDAITVARHLATEKAYREAIVASVPSIQKAIEAKADQAKADQAKTDQAKAAGQGGAAKPAEAAPDPAAGTQATPPKTEGGAAPADKDATSLPKQAGGLGAVEEVGKVLKAFDGSGFALGWPAPQFTGCTAKDACGVGTAVLMAAGWIVTALAVSLGAPFWFDLLNKFMVVRSTVKPSEKSGAEASKDSTPDRAASPNATLTLVVQPASSGAGGQGGEAG